MDCPSTDDTGAILREGSCLWARAGGGVLDQDASHGTSGFDQDSVTYQMGIKGELAPSWHLGFSAGYRHDWFDSDDGRSNSDGDSVFAGVALTRELGAWQLGAGLSGGYGWFDTTRKIEIAGFENHADSDPEVQNLSLRGHAAYRWGTDRLYLTPGLDLDLIYARQPGYHESGAGDLDLDVQGSDQWGLVATPSIEIGTRIGLDANNSLRAYAKAGASFATQDSWTSTAALAGAPAGSGSFQSEVPMDTAVGRIALGLQLATGDNLSLGIEYQGELSTRTTSNSGTLCLSFAF